jgi:hypothetical protein
METSPGTAQDRVPATKIPRKEPGSLWTRRRRKAESASELGEDKHFYTCPVIEQYATTYTRTAVRQRCNRTIPGCIIRDAIAESDWDHSCSSDVRFKCDVFLRSTYLLKYFKGLVGDLDYC